jgi:quinoprotein glucose dehydrogenase
MHWGGVTPRYSPEDFRLRSLYGVGDDWPISYDDLDPFYQEAEERMGIAGEQGPPEMDPRGKPFPMPALPLSPTLQQLREWTAKAGITMWSQPSAKNSVPYQGRGTCQRCDTCFPICPSGAKYSPDFTFDALVRAGRIRLATHTLVRRLVADPRTGRITLATGNATTGAGEAVRIKARQYVLAGGFVWAPHLLLLSADAKHPEGLANRSGLVGKYLCGHRNVAAQVRLPLKLYPGVNAQHSLVTKQFMRPGKLDRYIRHDLRVRESSYGQEPPLPDGAGATADAAPGGFADLLKQAAAGAMGTVQAGEAATSQALSGKPDMAQVVTAVSNAEVTLQAAVAVRDKVIQAYLDVIRMPI